MLIDTGVDIIMYNYVWYFFNNKHVSSSMGIIGEQVKPKAALMPPGLTPNTYVRMRGIALFSMQTLMCEQGCFKHFIYRFCCLISKENAS